MNFNIAEHDATQAFLVVLAIGAVVSTLAILLWATEKRRRHRANRPWYGEESVLIVVVLAPIFLTAIALMQVYLHTNKQLKEYANDAVAAGVEETYGLGLSSTSVENLRTYPNPDREGKDSYLTAESLTTERGTSEAYYYGTTDLVVDRKPLTVQLAWIGEWQLIDPETKEEIQVK